MCIFNRFNQSEACNLVLTRTKQAMFLNEIKILEKKRQRKEIHNQMMQNYYFKIGIKT